MIKVKQSSCQHYLEGSSLKEILEGGFERIGPFTKILFSVAFTGMDRLERKNRFEELMISLALSGMDRLF